MIQLKKTPRLALSHRAGTTLSEVLVSLLVMSVGVVALATLFPISVLRSVQATQLTNATNLRYNVEALVNAVPQIYTVGTAWQPSTTYAPNAVVTPTQFSSLKYPPLVAINTGVAAMSDLNEPNWMAANPLVDGGISWKIILLQNYIVDPQGEYIASYGDATELLRGASGAVHVFGNNASGPTSSIFSFAGVNFLNTPGAASPVDDFRAASFSMLPDSWITQSESTSVSYSGGTACVLNGLKGDVTEFTNTTVPAPSYYGAATVTPAAYAPSRVVLFDITGKVSHIRPILSVTGSMPNLTFDWTPIGGTVPMGPSAVLPLGPLPSGFVPARARIETLERRFSWLLSVRRGRSGSSSMDVVIFFRRQFSAKDERIYPATFQTGAIDPVNSNPAAGTWSFYAADPGYDGKPGIAGVSPDQPSELGFVGSDDVPRNWVVIQYDAAGDKPFYKRGGFVADATNLRWYRILDVVEGDLINGYTPASVMAKAGLNIASPYYVPDAPVATYQSVTFKSPRAVFLRLEKAIEQSGSVPMGGAGGTPTGGAIMMRGIVEVYPIRTQLSWEN